MLLKGVIILFSEQLKKLRKERGYTQEQLATLLKISKSAISMYENGNREPNFETEELIADFFNVDISTLRGKSQTFIPEGFMPVPKMKKVPRLGVISCGDPINSEENFDGYDDVPLHIVCDFTLICEGDSMTGARINDGDLVYIRQQPTIENGQIAAVLIDGTEKLLKRVYISDDSIILQAENPAYPPRSFNKEDMNRVSIIGKAVGFTSVLR